MLKTRFLDPAQGDAGQLPSASNRLTAAVRAATLRLVSDIVQLHRQTRPIGTDLPMTARPSTDQPALPQQPLSPPTLTRLHAVLCELLHPEDEEEEEAKQQQKQQKQLAQGDEEPCQGVVDAVPGGAEAAAHAQAALRCEVQDGDGEVYPGSGDQWAWWWDVPGYAGFMSGIENDDDDTKKRTGIRHPSCGMLSSPCVGIISQRVATSDSGSGSNPSCYRARGQSNGSGPDRMMAPEPGRQLGGGEEEEGPTAAAGAGVVGVRDVMVSEREATAAATAALPSGPSWRAPVPTPPLESLSVCFNPQPPLKPSSSSSFSPPPPSPPNLPPPPLSVGPCGLTHPGFLPGGYLRRPYALQLAWAAAVWRITGHFPYPLVRRMRPPLLQEGESYDAALAAAAALLSELLPLESRPLHNLENLESRSARRCGRGGGLPNSLDETADDDGSGAGSPVPPLPPPPLEDVISPTTPSRAASSMTSSLPYCAGSADVSVDMQGVTAAAAAAPRRPPLSSADIHDHNHDSWSPSAPLSSAESSSSTTAALVRLLLHPHLPYVLLGFRTTAGSAAGLVALPSLSECWRAFEALHAPPGAKGGMLTVGARALTKHTHRDLRGEWWPRMTGSEAAKNEAARVSLRRLLAGALWLNLHRLPPFDKPRYVLELRNQQGYGARWAIQDQPLVIPAAATTNITTTTIAHPSTLLHDSPILPPAPATCDTPPAVNMHASSTAAAAGGTGTQRHQPPLPPPTSTAQPPPLPPQPQIIRDAILPQHPPSSPTPTWAPTSYQATWPCPSPSVATATEVQSLPMAAAALSLTRPSSEPGGPIAVDAPVAVAATAAAAAPAPPVMPAEGKTAHAMEPACPPSHAEARPAASDTAAASTAVTAAGGRVVAVTSVARGGDGCGGGWVAFRGFLEPQMAGGHETGWRH